MTRLSLAAIARDPALLREVSTPAVAAIAAHATAILLERMASGGSEGDDRLMTAEEIAPVVGLTPRYLHGNASVLPFTVRPSPRRVRFSLRKAQAWVAEKARQGG